MEGFSPSGLLDMAVFIVTELNVILLAESSDFEDIMGLFGAKYPFILILPKNIPLSLSTIYPQKSKLSWHS